MIVRIQLGRAPLHCAAAGGQAHVVDTLITAGATLELTDKVSNFHRPITVLSSHL